MKLALHTRIPAQPRLQLSTQTRNVLFALICTLIPYAVAAIAVFAYHGQ
ncbi:hypothetical protein [Uliginosibacterium flavum]|uniref:Uncharacterized protein n=1 Tax=Uliginosibacterium flavum TaxID=1396831 RepID=A0ABV2THL8_9RHOO